MRIVDDRKEVKNYEDWRVGDIIEYTDEDTDTSIFAIIASTDSGDYSFIPLDSGDTSETRIADDDDFQWFVAKIKQSYPGAHRVKTVLHIEES